LRQGGFDPVAQINVNTGGGVSFLLHATQIKAGNEISGEKNWLFTGYLFV
jgi:hypothetical protein